MSVDRRFFVDIFEGLMPYIREQYDPINLEAPYFIPGTVKNITKQLKEKSSNPTLKFKKYPLIVLIMPMPEAHGSNYTILYEASPRVEILTPSDKNYNTGQRYDETYRTILYPIYDLLLESMARSNDILTYGGADKISHEKVDQLNYGDDERINQIFSGFLDGIDYQFNNLQIPRADKICDVT